MATHYLCHLSDCTALWPRKNSLNKKSETCLFVADIMDQKSVVFVLVGWSSSLTWLYFWEKGAAAPSILSNGNPFSISYLRKSDSHSQAGSNSCPLDPVHWLLDILQQLLLNLNSESLVWFGSSWCGTNRSWATRWVSSQPPTWRWRRKMWWRRRSNHILWLLYFTYFGFFLRCSIYRYFTPPGDPSIPYPTPYTYNTMVLHPSLTWYFCSEERSLNDSELNSFWLWLLEKPPSHSHWL